MDNKQLVDFLQLTDSAFPTGGFSHSLGLEAFTQHNGFVAARKDPKSLLQAFICILENTGSLSLPFVKAAHTAVIQGEKTGSEKSVRLVSALNGQTLLELDKLCEACTTNHIARRASTRQGKSFLEVSCFIYNDLANELRTSLMELPHCHYPVVYGAVLAGLGLEMEASQASFMFCVARSLIATAVRLDVLGAMEGQKIQLKLQQLLPEIIERNEDRPVDRACVKFPVLDVLQNTQDTLFCKLFYS